MKKKKAANKIRKPKIANGLIDGMPILAKPVAEPGTVDLGLQVYREWIGWHSQPILCAPAVHTRGWKQTAIFNDLHCPFQYDAAIAWAIANFAKDSQRCFVAGDAADMWSWSRFSKLVRESTPLRDYQSTQTILTLLAENFPVVDVMEGNHCTRQHKYFAEKLPPELLDYLELTGPDALHPMRRMIRELKNVSMIEPKRSGYAQFGFLYELGDAVISHAEIYSKIPNKAASNLVQWLCSYAVPQGLISPKFTVAMQAHTHQAGKTFDSFGKVSFELGCLCHTQGYQGSAKLQGTRPPQRGVTILVQDAEGKTDINATNFHKFPEEVEPVLNIHEVAA